MNLTMANWAQFSRQGKHYMERIKAGESFIIYHGGEPVGIIRPIDPDKVKITVEVEGEPD